MFRFLSAPRPRRGFITVWNPDVVQSSRATPVHIVTEESLDRYFMELGQLVRVQDLNKPRAVGLSRWDPVNQTVTSTLEAWCALEVRVEAWGTGAVKTHVTVVSEKEAHRATCLECIANYRGSQP